MANKKITLSHKRRHLDSLTNAIKKAVPKLSEGWIKSIRECLGITYAQLGNRLSLEQSTVRRLEAGELKKSISIANLEKLAAAMDCDLIYAIVPRTSLNDILKNRAEVVLKKEESLVNRTMALEDQLAKNDIDRDMKKSIMIAQLDKRLWEDL